MTKEERGEEGREGREEERVGGRKKKEKICQIKRLKTSVGDTNVIDVFRRTDRVIEFRN